MKGRPRHARAPAFLRVFTTLRSVSLHEECGEIAGLPSSLGNTAPYSRSPPAAPHRLRRPRGVCTSTMAPGCNVGSRPSLVHALRAGSSRALAQQPASCARERPTWHAISFGQRMTPARPALDVCARRTACSRGFRPLVAITATNPPVGLRWLHQALQQRRRIVVESANLSLGAFAPRAMILHDVVRESAAIRIFPRVKAPVRRLRGTRLRLSGEQPRGESIELGPAVSVGLTLAPTAVEQAHNAWPLHRADLPICLGWIQSEARAAR